ncbi:helix-turn-helix transcriptional regulator [Microbispora sp. NPDC046973]|uniref:helix-turn-helix domain-containing protein n=1 Tax=Microbispora sp. NPDC046973 TaxID=3155022 RepID=UPI003407AD54
MADEVRRAREAAGMTQRELAKEVSRQGVRMSTPTLSRCEMGRRAFKKEELAVIRRILAPASDTNRADDSTPGFGAPELGGNSAPELGTPAAIGLLPGGAQPAGGEAASARGVTAEAAGASAPGGGRGRRSHTGLRAPWAAVALGAGAIVLALVLALQVRTALTGGDAAASPSVSAFASASDAGVGCGRYEVAARDLWLRDRYGEPLVQLPHGLAVTDADRGDVTGAGGGDATGHYRHVSTMDGRSGWVDPAYLKPRCQ